MIHVMIMEEWQIYGYVIIEIAENDINLDCVIRAIERNRKKKKKKLNNNWRIKYDVIRDDNKMMKSRTFINLKILLKMIE